MVAEAKEHIDELNAKAYSLRTACSVEAAEIAELALSLSEEAGYQRGIGCALRTLAAAKVTTCLTTSFVNAVRAVDILLSESDRYEACSAYPVLYIYYANTGQSRLADQALQQCIDLAVQSNNRYVEAVGTYNLGSHHYNLGNYREAKENLLAAAAAALDVRNYQVFGLAMGDLAHMFHLNEEQTYGYSTLIQVLNELETSPYQPGLAEVLRAQFVYLFAIGDRAEAVKTYRKVRQHCKSTDNIREYLRVLTSRADYLAAENELLRARRTSLAVLKLLRANGLLLGEQEVLLDLASLAERLGEFENALQYLHAHGEAKAQLSCAASEARHRELEVLYRTNQFAFEADTARRQADSLSAVNEQLHLALERQTELQKELMRLASTDELTGAVNRRQIVNDGILEMERYRHTGSPFSVTIIDVDHFKGINDSFGHATGDEILRRLTKCCQALLRKFDVFGRLGGEEFCIVHHDTDTHGATMAVERIMSAIEKLFVADILPDRQFTISIGVAEVHEGDTSFYDVLHQADMALYEAKRAGRNTYRTVQSRVLEAA